MWKMIDLLPWWGKVILIGYLIAVFKVFAGLFVLAMIWADLTKRK